VVYPVQDLLVEAQPFVEPPQFDLSYATSRGSVGGSGGRGSGSSASQSLLGNYQNFNQQQNQPRVKDARAQELVDLIVDTVSPNIWLRNGGMARIRFFNGNLIVTAPRSVHEELGGPID
jgi:hypothetical protein